MKTINATIIATLFCTALFAKTTKADRLFEQWDYFRAAQLYEKEAAKHPSAAVYYKLGECYRKMKLYAAEQAAYDKVNAAGIYSLPEFYLNYGQVLKINGKNDQAQAAFNTYSRLTPSDTLGKFFSESIDIVAEDHKWDEPVLVSNVALLNTPNAEFCPVLYKDGVVFASNRKTPGRNKIYGWTGANYLDLYFAKSGSSSLNYSDVVPFPGANIGGKFNDGPACFSKNFDTIYISRVERDLKGKEKKTLNIERNKIYMSAMKDGKWTKAIPFPLNNDIYSVANPCLSPDGKRIYFVSDMPGGYGETDIYYCNRNGNGNGWGKPINMGPNVNTFNREKYPAMDSAGNFYFSSDGYQGFGGLDICVALNNNGTLAKAIPLKYPINSSADDFGIVFLKDGKTGYISSDRYDGGQGDDDIYYFDLLKDNDLVTSIYTIGYRPKPHETIVTAPIIAPLPPSVVTAIPPVDIHIYFDFDRSEIRADANIHLDSVIRYMNASKDLTLLIGGHCDSRGSNSYNMNLSQQRCYSALHYLKSKGIDTRRMTATGYGASQLVNHCDQRTECTDGQHQLNRSVYFRFEGEKIVHTNQPEIR